MLHRRIFVLAVAALTGACLSTEPQMPAATVTVHADTVQSSTSVGTRVTWLTFRVPVSVRNDDIVAIEEVGCAMDVEWLDGTEWRRAWSPVCTLIGGVHRYIQPGETRSYEMVVSAALEGPGAPDWSSPSITGTYRMSAGLTRTVRGGTVIPRIPSNSFVIRE
jgi:hypothetical protein